MRHLFSGTLLAMLFAGPMSAVAAFPAYVNYQGKLGNPAGNPLTGTYSFRFRLYSQATGGTLLATDATYTGANAVAVTNGLYSVQIGSLTAGGLPESAFHGSETWLEIDVSPGADFTGAETLAPRERLAAVPFAFRAAAAEKLGTGVNIATFTAAGDLTVPSSVTANAFFGDGAGITGITATGGVLKAGDTMTGQLTLAGSTLTVTGEQFSVGVSSFVVDGGSATVAYRMTAASYDASGAILSRNALLTPTDSCLAAGNGNTITSCGNSNAFGGYNTTSQNNSGAFGLNNSASAFASFAFGSGVTNSVTNSVMIGHGDTGKITMLSGGNVGIGTTTPRTILDVNGNAQFGSGATKSTFTAAGALSMAAGASIFTGPDTPYPGAVAQTGYGNIFVQGKPYTSGATGGQIYFDDRTAAGTNGMYVGLSANVQDAVAIGGTAATAPSEVIQVYGSDTVNKVALGGANFVPAGNVEIRGAKQGMDNSLFIMRVSSANGTSIMDVNASGSVGIGTASPCSTCTLHVAGGASVTGNLDVGGALRLKQVVETSSALGAGTDIDWTLGTIHTLTLTAGRTLTFSGAAAGQTITLIITQGGAGSFTITWPTMKWPSATAPTLTTTAGKADMVSVFYDGTSYWGFVGGQNY